LGGQGGKKEETRSERRPDHANGIATGEALDHGPGMRCPGPLPALPDWWGEAGEKIRKGKARGRNGPGAPTQENPRKLWGRGERGVLESLTLTVFWLVEEGDKEKRWGGCQTRKPVKGRSRKGSVMDSDHAADSGTIRPKQPQGENNPKTTQHRVSDGNAVGRGR